MKSCPSCQRVYPNDAGFCPADGTALMSASMAPPPTAPDDPRVGQLFAGRYEIRRVVADGGMGRVYEGIDRRTDTRIAVKVLHDDVAKDEVSLERFKREYEISSQLPHDYIVNVYDFQHEPSLKVWILVMEFLDGEELRVVTKRDKFLQPDRLIRMVSQVAIGLDCAEERFAGCGGVGTCAGLVEEGRGAGGDAANQLAEVGANVVERGAAGPTPSCRSRA